MNQLLMLMGLLLVVACTALPAQQVISGRTLTIEEALRIAEQNRDTNGITFKGCVVTSKFIEESSGVYNVPICKNLKVNFALLFDNCTFKEIDSNQKFILSDGAFGVVIVKSTFSRGLKFQSCDINDGYLKLDSCVVSGLWGLWLDETKLGSLQILNNMISGVYIFLKSDGTPLSAADIVISSNVFDVGRSVVMKRPNGTDYFYHDFLNPKECKYRPCVIINNTNSSSLSLIQNVIRNDSKIEAAIAFAIRNCKIENFIFSDTLSCILLTVSKTNILSRLTILGNSTMHPISLDEVKIEAPFLAIDVGRLNPRRPFGLFGDMQYFDKQRLTYFNPSALYPLPDTLQRFFIDFKYKSPRDNNKEYYLKTQGTYLLLRDKLKAQGDLENANLLYIAYKNYETLKLAHDYKLNPTLRNWSLWQTNRFIGFFCDYGTDPTKALVYAFYIVLCFGVLYFLFPSEPDNLSRTSWLPFFSTLQAYITQHVQLPELSRADQERKVQRLQQFKENLETARQDMPPALAWLSLPLYHSATAYYRLQGWLLRRADVLPEAWSQLSPGRKFSKGFLITTYAFLFLLWGLVVRLLNALALSLNAFVTLGYGEIQARGIARYLAVLEGVCGWFLLSIFSVSLITQLMQ